MYVYMKKLGREEKCGLGSGNVSSSCHSFLRSKPAAFEQADSPLSCDVNQALSPVCVEASTTP
jgi:hypothetical protein